MIKKGDIAMDGYDVNLSIEPKDRYEKAKKDVIQAMKSMQELTSQQRDQLAKELFGLEAVAYIQRMMQRRF